LSILLAALLVTLFIRTEHKYGPYVSVGFVALVPFLTLTTSLLLDVRLFAGVYLGGHGWPRVAATFLVALVIMGLDMGQLRHQVRSLRDRTDATIGVSGEE
jgi:hypothetical protein